MFDSEQLYINRVNAQERRFLEELTLPRAWDYGRFRQVLIGLGSIGKGAAIPAINRPDSVHIQGIRPFVDRLSRLTKANGVEYGQTVLVDREEQSLLMGKIFPGGKEEVSLDARTAPGREGKQHCVGIAHVHPKWGIDKWLSDTDYKTFLLFDIQMMLMTYGEGQMLMALKTSATPNNFTEEGVDDRLRELSHDFFTNGNGDGFARLENFNKQVCTEFGSVLYSNAGSGGDLMNRVEVTE